LGAGGAAANGFSRCLRKAGGYYLVGTNSNPHDIELAETDETHLVPHSSEDGYRPEILRLVDELDIDLVHAQPDPEVYELSCMRDRVPVFLPDHLVVRRCQDKWLTYAAWKHNAKVPQPDTTLIVFPGDLEEPLRKHKRVWLRNRHGAGGAGSVVTGDFLFGVEWIRRQNGFGCFTAAEVLTETTVTWQSVWYDGELVVAQGRKRLHWANSRGSASGVSGATGVGETYQSTELDSIAYAAVQSIDRKPHGIYGVDCALDKKGVPNPTEINIGRFFTTIQFFAELGLNLPDLYCQLAFEYTPNRALLNPLKPGWRWIRSMDKEPVLVR
jgi:carbamoyl-phosphate synthase large subunit